MGKLEDVELTMQLTGNYEAYKSLAEHETSSGRQDQFDQVRYMLSIAHHAEEESSEDKITFVGGLAVLGHVVKHLGTESISKWRGTRDIDVVLQERSYDYLLSNAFDVLDVNQKSISIPNKLTVRGYSHDVKREALKATSIDAYIPDGKPANGVPLPGVRLDTEFKNHSVKTDIFGVEVYHVNVPTLLALKLEIGPTKHRVQDLEDIIHLVAFSEREKIKAQTLQSYLSPGMRERLKSIISTSYAGGNPILRRILVHPSCGYRRELTK